MLYCRKTNNLKKGKSLGRGYSVSDMLILSFSIASKYSQICTPGICWKLQICVLLPLHWLCWAFLFNLALSLWQYMTRRSVYVAHEDVVWSIVGVTLDLLCSHSFSEAQVPLVIINGLNKLLWCSLECTSLHIHQGFNKLIVNHHFPPLHHSTAI